MKQKLSLLDVCKLPDVQLHSKTAFFKSIVGRESSEVTQMKDHIASLSYTVKVIGVQGEEVGITSKRVPLTLKKQEDKKAKNHFVPVQNYLPHKSFYSHALVPVHLPKDPSKGKEQPLFAISPNGAIRVDSEQRMTSTFKTRAKSMATLSTTRKRRLIENVNELGKIRGREGQSGLKKKSYSGLLRQCNGSVSERIDPLLHEENPLFKKIQKIKGIYPQTTRFSIRMERYESLSRPGPSSQTSAIHYEDQL